MPKTAIFDLDGTLCNVAHRIKLAHDKRWEEFHEGICDDIPHEAAVEVARAMALAQHPVAYCTGRPERYREATVDWLTRYDLPSGTLLMRNNNDYGSDFIVKPARLAKNELTPDVVLFIMEDRDRMVERWRSLGYVCFQAYKGTY